MKQWHLQNLYQHGKCVCAIVQINNQCYYFSLSVWVCERGTVSVHVLESIEYWHFRHIAAWKKIEYMHVTQIGIYP